MTETPTIRLDGRLDTRTVPAAWREAMAVLRRHSAVSVVVDAAAVDYCDGAGVALLLHLLSQRRPNGAAVTLQGLAPKYQALLAQFKLDDCRALDELAGGVKAESLPNRVGRITYAMWRDLREMVEFTGECLAACARVVVRPTRVRWGDVLSEVSVSPARLVWHQAYNRRVPLAGSGPAQVAQGLDTALTGVLGDLCAGLRTGLVTEAAASK